MSVLTMNYDRKYDILYARNPNGGHSYGEEDTDGIVIYRNIETDSITGIAIHSIKAKLNNGKIDLSLLPIPLNSFNQKIQTLLNQ